MSKFILIDSYNRVSHVEDTRPVDALPWKEVSNDLVQPFWWSDPVTGELSEYRPYGLDEVRKFRNKYLALTDWMVLPDSKYRKAGQESNLTIIENYRQQLRDFPDPNFSYNENNLHLPDLPVLS